LVDHSRIGYHLTFMRIGLFLTIAAGCVLSAVTVRAESRTTAMVVRVSVVRSCSINTNSSAMPAGAVNVTCTRSATTDSVNVATSTPAANTASAIGSPLTSTATTTTTAVLPGDARVVPLRPLQTTPSLPARPALLLSPTQATRFALAERQLVTLNF
jgi:hypothetical protein